jgi:hypothetical protein
MLGTCEQLAAGLGAAGVKRAKGELKKGEAEKENETAAVGNAPLRLWVGERYLGVLSSFLSIYITDWYRSHAELYKRMGKDSRAQKQANANRLLTHAVENIARRGLAGS